MADEDGSGIRKLGDCGSYYYKRLSFDCTYPMGTDPIWGIATNRLTYVNGIKMKLSVIFGVLHMTMGILHKGTNTIYFRDWPSFITEVVVGLIILLGLFGWMDLLVIGKWLTPLDIDDDSDNKDPRCGTTPAPGLDTNDLSEGAQGPTAGECLNQQTPSVINLMIDTVFNFGTSKNPKMNSFIGKDLESQMTIGLVLLIIVVILIPVMLFVKPCCFRGDAGHDDEEHNQIEFANIQNADNQNQAINPSVAEGDTENQINKRQDEMKQLEQQIQAMSEKTHGHSFSEAFIH